MIVCKYIVCRNVRFRVRQTEKNQVSFRINLFKLRIVGLLIKIDQNVHMLADDTVFVLSKSGNFLVDGSPARNNRGSWRGSSVSSVCSSVSKARIRSLKRGIDLVNFHQQRRTGGLSWCSTKKRNQKVGVWGSGVGKFSDAFPLAPPDEKSTEGNQNRGPRRRCIERCSRFRSTHEFRRFLIIYDRSAISMGFIGRTN